MKAMMLFSVAECVGQWKWIIFTRAERKLLDFERIDLASRGPLGSFGLAWRRETPGVLRIGVIVTILCLALDPFSQQLIQVEEGLRPGDSGIIDAVNAERATGYYLGKVRVANVTNSSDSNARLPVFRMDAEVTPAMEAAILNGVSLPLDSIHQQSTLRCPSINCTWPQYNTIGVCQSCSNMTADLKRVDNFGDFFTASFKSRGFDNELEKNSTTAFALENGHFLANINKCEIGWEDTDSCYDETRGNAIGKYQMTSFGTGNPNKTNTMKDTEALIWSISAIYIDETARQNRKDAYLSENGYSIDARASEKNQAWNSWPGIPLGAAECALYYCVRSVETKLENNTINELFRENVSVVVDPSSWKVDASNNKVTAPENWPQTDGVLESKEFDPLYSFINMTTLQFHNPQDSNEDIYYLNDQAVKSISSHFQQLLRDSSAANSTMKEAANQILGMKDAATFNGMLQQSSSTPKWLEPAWGGSHFMMTDRFEGLALSMTKEMRSRSNDGTSVTGTILLPRSLYRVVWGWIALHGVLLIAGTMFCLFTISISKGQTKTVPAWKTSALAALSQGIVAAKALHGAKTVDEMERRADKEIVTMSVGERIEELSDLSRRQNWQHDRLSLVEGDQIDRGSQREG